MALKHFIEWELSTTQRIKQQLDFNQIKNLVFQMMLWESDMTIYRIGENIYPYTW